MRQLPRPVTLAARLTLAFTWLVGLVGPLPAAAPVFAAPPASLPAGVPPSNDDFANAAVITLPPDYVSQPDLLAATSQSAAGEPWACGTPDMPSVWYTYTPAATGFFGFDTFGTTITHSLSIFFGSSLAELTALDCALGPNTGDGTGLSLILSAGQTYYVRFASDEEVVKAAGAPQGLGEAVLSVYAPATVSGTVWDDADGDGEQDGSEPGLPGASVYLLDDFFDVVGVTNTDLDGHYVFAGLPSSTTLALGFAPPPPGPWLGSPLDAVGDSLDSDADPDTGATLTFTLQSLETLDFDAGFGRPAVIAGRAWRDLNSNDLQDPGEPGLADSYICLQTEFIIAAAAPQGPGLCYAETYTGADGSYSFTVPAGDYWITFSSWAPSLTFATPNAGDDALDSDAGDTDGLVPTFTVSLGDVVDFDGGYQTTGLGDRVWRDLNGDGVQDPDEPGVQGVMVELYDNSGYLSNSATDVNGEYVFYNLAPGDYAAVFYLPTGNSFSPQNAGGDDARDSDADVSTGRSVTVTLSAGELDLSVDAGMTKPDFIVDNLNEYPDTTPGDGLCDDTTSVASAPYGECSLRAAIHEANADPDFDVILFDGTVFSVTQTIAQTSGYTVTTGLWVHGPGSDLLTLDGGSVTRQFLIINGYDTEARLTGLRLDNGRAENDAYSDDGGAIYNASALLTLEDIYIYQAYAVYFGGGLYNSYPAELTDVTIANSDSGTGGGGLYNSDVLSATNLLLAGNTSDRGGGLYNDGQALLVSSAITGNVATDDDGGGILTYGPLHLDDSVVHYNTARWDGGGIASGGGKQLTGIAVPCAGGCGPSYSAAITLTTATAVSHNVAGVPDDYPAFGGGIYNGAGPLLVDGSEIFSNTVYGYGGGIYNEGAELFNLQSVAGLSPCDFCPAVATLQSASELYLNTALSTTVVFEDDPVYTDTYPSLGGGLFNAGLAFVDNSELWGNTANQGGGFYNAFLNTECLCSLGAGYLPTLFVVNTSQVTSNLAALEGDDAYGFIFSGGPATGLGGGGFNGGLAQVVESEINSNVAGLWGGGVFNGVIDALTTLSGQGLGPFSLSTLPQLELIDSVVGSNDADPADFTAGIGGGVFNFIGRVELDHTTVAYNSASVWGGGLANGCVFCFFVGQTGSAAVMPQGSAIFIFSLLSQLYVHNGSTIHDNRADPLVNEFISAGGGLFNAGYASIAASALLSNTTGLGVGAGAFNSFYLTLDSTRVDANEAGSDGGGIFNYDLNFSAADVAASLAAQVSPAGIFVGLLFDFVPGLSVEAPLVIRNGSTLNNNRANPDDLDEAGGYGGGLLTQSPALITDSNISGNWAARDGGGLAVDPLLTRLSSAPASSAACLQGPIIFLIQGVYDRVVLNNTTVSFNAAGQTAVKGEPQGVGGGAYVGGNYPCDALPLEANQSLFESNSATAGGGGLFVDYGEAYLHGTHLRNNNADSDDDGYGDGGASYNHNGYLLIDPANVTGNLAVNGGGGYYENGTTLITQTTFATNTAAFFGGGLYISGTAQVTVGNSTFSANNAGGTGGALYQQDDTTSLTLANVTIANNTVGEPGVSVAGAGVAGYFRAGTGPAVISNTLIYGNDGPASDCNFISPATNVSGVANMGDSTCSFVPGWTTDDPELGPLQYNGGPNGILTHALGSLSPAIDAADTGVCGAAPVYGVDERNVPRLLDLACDIGAYEFETLTAIELVSFIATAQGDQVTLAWETAVELDTAGFNLYRAAAPGGPYVPVNALLIAALGPPGGSYTFPDAPGLGTWYYRLEDVSTGGQHTLHGPASVTVGSGSTASYQIYLPRVGN